jgi:hypothetical protein
MRIIEIVRRAGPNGIMSTDLFDMIYGNDPNGGPTWGTNTLSSRISKINAKLKPDSKRIKSRRCGSLPSEYVFEDAAGA